MAKVTLSFVTEDTSKISIENDTDRNRDYKGNVKKKFRYGDSAYFRVYCHEPERITLASTDGEVSEHGIFSDTVTETLTFITEQYAETDKPVIKVQNVRWLGNSLGEVIRNEAYQLKTSERPDSRKIAAVNVSYLSRYKLYSITLSGRELDEYPVAIFVSMSDG